MDKDKEWVGEWLIPIKGKIFTFFGTLTYRVGERPILKISSREQVIPVLGFFGEMFSSDDLNVIKGVEHKSGKPLVLIDNDFESYSIGTGALLTIRVGRIIDDVEYVDADSLNYDVVSVELSGIGEWIGQRGFLPPKFHPMGISQSFYGDNYPEDISFSINDQFTFKLWFSYASGGSGSKFIHQVKEKFHIELNSRDQKVSIQQWFKMIEKLRRLLTILQNDDCFPITFRVGNYSATNEDPTPYVYDYKNVYFKPVSKKFPKDDVRFFEMIHTYEEIENIFPSVVQKWFNYTDQSDIEYVHWVLSQIINQFSVDVFLEKVRAIEAFHRVKNNKLTYSDDLKETLIRQLIDNLRGDNFFDILQMCSQENDVQVEQILSKIEGNLKYINEQTLRDRLKFLLKDIRDKVDKEDFVEAFGDWKGLINYVVINRNYYTHYDKNSYSNDNVLDVFKLFDLSVKLRKVLLVIVLEDLGIPPYRTLRKLSNRRN
ncbi:HEPN domain-containing protein [Spirosoma sp. KUDC1026]|uniref:ApeA N-terminal domain 1-containing protein n=1 Tax=Spirosoma sp. KUDC1026 TaxID=2745947 RepID=UPI00159B8BCB|nr:HEPN domain-containing protein [Spirosoma sp. KUDC1026]QKZ14722.1 hypothetical protein HU175_19665 [Spirosoma sp. KUDC1026]